MNQIAKFALSLTILFVFGTVAINSFGAINISFTQLNVYDSNNHYGTAIRKGTDDVPILKISIGINDILEELELKYTGTRRADIGPYASLYNSAGTLVNERSFNSDGVVRFDVGENTPEVYVVKIDVVAGAGSNRVKLKVENVILGSGEFVITPSDYTNYDDIAFIDASAPELDNLTPFDVTVLVDGTPIDVAVAGYHGVYDVGTKILKLRFCDKLNPMASDGKVDNPLVRLVWAAGISAAQPQVDLSKIILRAPDDDPGINLSSAALLCPPLDIVRYYAAGSQPTEGNTFPDGTSAFSSEVWIKLTYAQDAYLQNTILPDSSTETATKDGTTYKVVELYINAALWDAGSAVGANLTPQTAPTDGDFKNFIYEEVKLILVTNIPPVTTSPTHPSQARWYASPDVRFTWQKVEGVIGYYVILDEKHTIPTPETAQDYVIGAEKTYQNLKDGTWYFHIRGEFKDGTLTYSNKYRVNIDSTPEISSSSHPDQQKWYQSREVKMNWSIQDIPSATAFYHILDDKSDTSPDKSNATKTNKTSLETPLPSDDEWYFHLVWEDEVGSISKTAHYKLAVDATPSEPVTQLSVLLTDEGHINLSWVEPKDNASGVANYQIFRSKFSGAIGVSVGDEPEVMATSATTEFVDETAEKGQVYYYTVMPVDKAGNKQVNGNVQISTENAPTEGTLSIQPFEGYVGDEVEINGLGFKANEQVKVKLSDVEVTVKAGEDGSFKATLKVPMLTGGKHVLVAEGESRRVEGWFEIKGRVSEVTPSKASVGSIVTIVGDGFAENAKVSVTIGGETTSIVSGMEITTDGRLSTDVVVPKVGLGIQTLTVNDGQNEVTSSIQLFEGEPMASGKGKFIMELAKGLNMVSLPLKPDFEMDAKGFGELLEATVVIQLNKETKQFVPFIPTVDMTNFPIEGGKGYIVNVLESKSVEVEGKAWFSAPGQHDKSEEPVWAFAVGGEVGFGERVVVRNARSGEAASGIVREGWFGVVLGGIQGREVVREGDEIEVLIYDGGKLVGRGEMEVGIEELERAVGLVRVERLPERTELLPNYPNPFNPETWIPFRLSEDLDVKIRIYNLQGRMVRELAFDRLKAGVYERRDQAAYWDGRNEQGELVSSGVYIIELSTTGFRAVRKGCLMK